mmetsp:Transcript_21424/g.48656  ORF Transcript_21424/g.48656 Transcript_21424/m.48656 type:complete len:245 (-) Transcript_21424:124-858(-)
MGGKSSLNLPDILSSSPIHSGSVLKLSSSPFYTSLPSPIQYVLSYIPAFSLQWKSRHMVAIGNYLYKFEETKSDTYDEILNSKEKNWKNSIKGSPVPLEGIEATLIAVRGDIVTDHEHLESDDSLAALEQHFYIEDCGSVPFPDGYDAILRVRTFYKTRYFALPTREEAAAWIHSLSHGASESIVRRLGHGGEKPLPDSWRHYDAIGKDLYQKKIRIKQQLERMNLRQDSSMWMSPMAGSGIYG